MQEQWVHITGIYMHVIAWPNIHVIAWPILNVITWPNYNVILQFHLPVPFAA